MNLKKLGFSLLLASILIGFSSWGFLVHRTVHQLAIYSLPAPLQSFFHADMKNLVDNAPRPDTRRNTDKSEATKHFVDLEAFGPNAANEMPLDWAAAQKKYTKDSLLKYGWGPYNAIIQFDNLVAAFKAKNKDSILFYAADLGHYLGDLNVPLHTTINYDGQLTGQKGMHGLWESFIPELRINQYQLYNSHKATFLKDPAAALWENIRFANSLLPTMLAKEKAVSNAFTPEQKYKMQMYYGRNTRMYTKEFAEAYANELGPTINAQLTASANLIADFWYTAWVKGGKPRFTTKSFSNDLNVELESFKRNKLIQDSLLLAKKVKSEE
ncbi:MAG: zinc dependent phospholipase C family protein [Sediminibacterium sp.]